MSAEQTPDIEAVLADLDSAAWEAWHIFLSLPVTPSPLGDRMQRHRQELKRIRAALAPVLAAAVCEAGGAHECKTTPLCHSWPFGVDDAYRTIAAVAWPAEREENRDGWAVTMRNRPDLFEQEATRARERLEAAIAHGRAAIVRADRVAEPQHEAGPERLDHAIRMAEFYASQAAGIRASLDAAEPQHETAPSGNESEASDE